MQAKQGPDGLTDKQRRFVRERRKDPNASWAEIVRRAGYLDHNPAERARVLLLDPRVTSALYGGSPHSAMRAIISSDRSPESAKRRAARKMIRAQVDVLSGIRFEDGVLVTSRRAAALALARLAVLEGTRHGREPSRPRQRRRRAKG